MLALVVEGLKSTEIGRRLGVTEATIKKHMTSLLRKFDAANRAELAAKAIRWGIVLSHGHDESAEPGQITGDMLGGPGPTPSPPPEEQP